MVLANSATVMALRNASIHAARTPGPRYINGTVIVMGEVLKIAVSAALYCMEYDRGEALEEEEEGAATPVPPPTTSSTGGSNTSATAAAAAATATTAPAPALFMRRKPPLTAFPAFLFRKVFVQWQDTARMAVPGVLYVVQNNLLVFALSKLDSVTFQITYVLAVVVFTIRLFHISFLQLRKNYYDALDIWMKLWYYSLQHTTRNEECISIDFKLLSN